LPGFQQHFGLTSSAKAIKDYISLVYIGAGVGAGLSFFINDRIGRLWSLRLYLAIWIVGQLVATFSPGLAGLYASRIICGFGIGPLTVIGPVALSEIAPTEIRGLITAWFTVALLFALFVASFTTYGVLTTMAATRLQYQVVWFAPCIFLAVAILVSFFYCEESPRWLFLVDRYEEGTRALVALRGLPADHPRIELELRGIQESIQQERAAFESGSPGSKPNSNLIGIVKETFLVPANLRRVQQALLSYALAQLSGANSVTSYFVPILQLMGVATPGDSKRALFLSSMYSMAKFFFTLIASFFLIDALGRRKSLFLGIILQMLSDIYIGVYIKYKQAGNVPHSASEAAIAAIFIHGFGYTVGKYTVGYNSQRVELITIISRSLNSPLRLYWRNLAQSYSVIWWCTQPVLPLAFLLRCQLRYSFTARKHKQLGRFHLLRRLVFHRICLCLFHGPRNCWIKCRRD